MKCIIQCVTVLGFTVLKCDLSVLVCLQLTCFYYHIEFFVIQIDIAPLSISCCKILSPGPTVKQFYGNSSHSVDQKGVCK